MFDVEIEREELTEDSIRAWFMEQGNTIDEWKGMTQRERKKLKINDHGLIAIAKKM